jgi:ArsR family transcriptional regulator, arsenate/arsenite/antimonite-responsive transcriptional repressor / arsenate reductase (thioredoxin)
VLFLWTGNSARSPMAAALLRHRSGGKVDAVSAGSQPKPLKPQAVRALSDYGIDLSGHQPQHLSSYVDESFDYVISLCDRVREVCPEFPEHPAYVHWSIPDPSTETSDDAGSTSGSSADSYARTAAELDARIRFLIPILDTQQHREVSS